MFRFNQKLKKHPFRMAVLLTAVLSLRVCTVFADTSTSDTPLISDVPAISDPVPETKAAQKTSAAPVIGDDPVISGGSSGSGNEKHAQEIGSDNNKSSTGKASTEIGTSAEKKKEQETKAQTVKEQETKAQTVKEQETKAQTSAVQETKAAAKDSAQISDAPKASGNAAGGEISSAPMASATGTATQAPADPSQKASAAVQSGQTGSQANVSIAGPSSGKSSGAAGSNHANDAVSRISLDFSLITPVHSRGNMNVARGCIQLSNGSRQEFDYKDNIHYAFYKQKATKTDSDGTFWYVASVRARRFGDATAEDGELKTELWLNASDCITRSTVDVNTTSSTRIAIVKAALAMLGRQYVYGGNGPDAYDCSGLAKAVYKEAGITVPRTSTQMLQMDGEISAADLRPGDLMVRSGHCGIYIGNGIFVHASDSSVGVVAEYLSVYNLSNKFTNYFNVVGD